MDLSHSLASNPQSFSHMVVNDDLITAIIDERVLYAQCLRQSLERIRPLRRFEALGSITEWLAYKQDSPAILLVSIPTETRDVESYVRKCVDAAQLLRPATALVMMMDGESPSDALKILDGGARGFVPTTFPVHLVAQALDLVAAGGVFVPATCLSTFARIASNHDVSAPGDVFTARQLAVAKALRKGTPNKVIAYNLNMAESTVKVHVRHIMKKLKAKNRTQVAYLTNTLFSSSEE